MRAHHLERAGGEAIGVVARALLEHDDARAALGQLGGDDARRRRRRRSRRRRPRSARGVRSRLTVAPPRAAARARARATASASQPSASATAGSSKRSPRQQPVGEPGRSARSGAAAARRADGASERDAAARSAPRCGCGAAATKRSTASRASSPAPAHAASSATAAAAASPSPVAHCRRRARVQRGPVVAVARRSPPNASQPRQVQLAHRVHDQLEDEVAGGVDDRGHEVPVGQQRAVVVVGARDARRPAPRASSACSSLRRCAASRAASASSSRRASNSERTTSRSTLVSSASASSPPERRQSSTRIASPWRTSTSRSCSRRLTASRTVAMLTSRSAASARCGRQPLARLVASAEDRLAQPREDLVGNRLARKRRSHARSVSVFRTILRRCDSARWVGRDRRRCATQLR